MRPILVTGATGSAGREIVKSLQRRGAKVRILTRNVERAAQSFGSGIEVWRGDFHDLGSLHAALDGVERALLLAPNTPEQVASERNFIAAAVRSGVRHVVEFSGLGAAKEAPARIERFHGLIEATLEGSGMAFTHLRPNTFMQNLLASAGTIASDGAIYVPIRDYRISFVDVRDVAEVAAITLLETGHEGRSYTITGSEALSYRQAAEKLAAAIGKSISVVEIDAETFKAEHVAQGSSPWLVDALLELRHPDTEIQSSQVTSAVREVTGRAATLFEEFARDYAPAFAL
jgi:uncharacterized protein YbjT (DUF2867 family)